MFFSCDWQASSEDRRIGQEEQNPAGSAPGLGVSEHITGHLLTKAGCQRTQAQTGAVTLIQRFGSALNFNIHFHMLFLDGVYRCAPDQRFRFVSVAAPAPADLARLIEQINQRVARHLERQVWLVRDEDNSYLTWDAEQASALDDVIGHAVTYRIAVGPHCGQRAFTLQTLPAMPAAEDEDRSVARAGGFSLHAGIVARADQRAKLERLCRYVARPAVATQRLSLTRQGDIRYSPKTPIVTAPLTGDGPQACGQHRNAA